MNCINFNNKIYFIEKNHNENNNSFIKRFWYIIKLHNENNNKNYLHNNDINKIINMSNVYINKVKNDCRY